MLQIVLSQQILSVVIAIRSPDNRMHVCQVRDVRRQQVPEPDRPLMIKLDQDHGAVNAVVEGGARSVSPIQANFVRARWVCTSSIFTLAWPSSMLST